MPFLALFLLDSVLTDKCVDRFKILHEQRTLDDLTRCNCDLYECFTTVNIECNHIIEYVNYTPSIIKELDLLRERAHTMQAGPDACNEHAARLEEENRSRWQEHNSQLLRKVCLFVRLARCTCTDSRVAV
jgi:hypothetical protein